MRLRDCVTYERVLSSREDRCSSSFWTERIVTTDAWRSPPSTPLMQGSLPCCGRCRLLQSARMKPRRSLVLSRFPGACYSSNVRILRKESIAYFRSMKLPRTAFSQYVDMLINDYLERPAARIRVAPMFWICYLLQQTGLALYVIERQTGIED